MKKELLKKIQSRCEEVGDCLEWQGHVSSGGSPRIWHEGKTQSARKLMLKAHGKPCDVPPKHKLMTTCENPRCIHPDHLVIVPMAKFVRDRLVANTNHQIRAAKIAKTLRQSAKLTADDVAAIRASDEADPSWPNAMG